MKFYLPLILLGTCSLLPYWSNAQVLNIEKFRLNSDTSNVWVGTIGGGISSKKQINDILTIKTDVNAAYLSKQHSYLFLSTLKVVKIDQANELNDGYAHFRITFWRKNKISPEQFNQIQHDPGRGLTSRKLTGLGAHFNLVSTDHLEFGMSSSGMYEYEKWQNTSENHFFKLSESLSLRYNVSPTVSIFITSFYQARPNTFFLPRITTDASIQLSFSNKFKFRFQIISTYDTNPVIDIDKHIFGTETTLVYQF